MKSFFINFTILLVMNILFAVYLPMIDIQNIYPSVHIAIVVLYASYFPLDKSLVAGFLIGILYDSFFGVYFGYNAFLYMWIAYFTNKAIRKYFGNEPIIVCALALAASFVYNVITYFFFYLFSGKTYFGTFLFKIILPEMIYTLLIFFVLYNVFMFYRDKAKKLRI